MDTLSIQSASAIQQSKYAGQIAAVIAMKAIDVQKFQGQVAAALVKQSANVGKQPVDVSQQIANGYIDVEL